MAKKNNLPIYISVGKPISVLKSYSNLTQKEPTQEQIDSTHESYLKALKELYEEYNPIYGDPRVHLKFIWIVKNYKFFIENKIQQKTITEFSLIVHE